MVSKIRFAAAVQYNNVTKTIISGWIWTLDYKLIVT